MNKLIYIASIIGVSLVASNAAVHADSSEQNKSKVMDNRKAAIQLFSKKLKKKRRPVFKKYIANRVGGAVRGNLHTSVANLGPPSVGLSSVSEPTLCWSLDADTKDPIEITIVEQSDDQFEYFEPILETKINSYHRAGIHCYSLKTAKVQLEPETVYLWSTRVLSNPDDLSDNAIAQAYVLYSDQVEPEFFYDKIASASDSERRSILRELKLAE